MAKTSTKAHSSESETASVTSRNEPKTIELNIVLPSLPTMVAYRHILDSIKYAPLPMRRSRLVFAASCVTLSAMAGGFLLAKSLHSGGDTSQIVSVQQLPKGNPKFAALVPAGKNMKQLGGWTRVSPPDREEVYAYTDKIGAASISVSQQPLPQEFRVDSDEKIKQLAESFLATEKVTVGSTVFYIGTSAEGPQSVILSKKNLLILMKSNGKINSNHWAEYVNSLE